MALVNSKVYSDNQEGKTGDVLEDIIAHKIII